MMFGFTKKHSSCRKVIMTDEGKYFVTRSKDNMKYEVLEVYTISEDEKHKGIIKDQRIKVQYKEDKKC